MVRVLALAAIAWPLLLGGALLHRATHGATFWTSVVYAASSRICHQRPERSFSTAGVQWPVCGRCSGMYLGAAAGVLPALLLMRRGSRRIRAVPFLAAAVAPNAVLFAAEWLNLFPVTTPMRFVTGLPLGAAILIVILAELRRR